MTIQIFQVSFCAFLLFALHSLFQLINYGKASVARLQLSQMVQMTLMGISDMFYIISITCAFQKAKPSAIVLFTYSMIVFAFIADVVVFK